MVLNVILLILFLAIVYWHYSQGFLSAMISAILAISAGVMALAWADWLVALVSGGKFHDYAHAALLVAIFAGVYLVLRVLFDMAVPGNVQYPWVLDRIGSAALGVVAAIPAIGVLALSAQLLPVGPTVAGFDRFPVGAERLLTLRTSSDQRGKDCALTLVDDAKVRSGESASLWIPADAMLAAWVTSLSSPSGSLENGAPFARVHPDLLTQVFLDRVGLQPASKRTVVRAVECKGVFVPANLGVRDAELPEIVKVAPNAAPKPSAEQRYLVVRLAFNLDDTDENRILAISCGNVRMVIPGSDGSYRDIYPVGTLAADGTLLTNRLDDPLFLLEGKENTPGLHADFVFVVDRRVVSEKRQLLPGVHLYAKRTGSIDLGSRKAEPAWAADPNAIIARRTPGK